MTWNTQPDPINTISGSGELDLSAGTVIATGSTAARSLADRLSDAINVKDFGASAEASASYNTGAINDAFAAAVERVTATVVFPGEEYDHDDTLLLAPSSGQIHINILGLGGAGSNGVRLNYTGSGVAFTIKNNTRYSLENISLINGGTGTSGLVLTSLTNGSNHGSAWYNKLFVSGFDTGIAIGDSDNKAASELLFGMVEVIGCEDGILITGKTDEPMFSTNIRFLFLASSNCGTQLRVTGNKSDDGAGVAVFGGSTSFNDREFDFEVPGTYYIGHQRIEGTLGQLVRSGNADPTLNSEYVTNVTIEDIKCNYTAAVDGKVALFYQPGHYAVKHSTLQTGYIELGGFDGGGAARKSTLSVKQSTIVRSGAPIRYKADSNTIWDVDHDQSGNTVAEAQNMDESRRYIIDTDGNELTLAKYGAWSESPSGAALTATLGIRDVATADLPAAAAAMDNSIIIEEAGANTCNLVVYKNGERFKVALTES